MRKTLNLILAGLYLLFLVITASAQDSRGHTERINGSEMFYRVSGEGPPLFLLHGWLQTSASWHPYVIENLAHNYTVYQFDLRGHGNSSLLTSDFSIQQVARDITTFADRKKIESFHAIGLSFGSIVLLQLAFDQPELMDRMVLMSGNYDYNGQEASKEMSFSYDSLDQDFKDYLIDSHANGESQVKLLFDQDIDFDISLSKEIYRKLKPLP